jgi:hypothetical protein
MNSIMIEKEIKMMRKTYFEKKRRKMLSNIIYEVYNTGDFYRRIYEY